MSDRKWSFKLRLFAVFNFLIGLIAAIIQVVILSREPDIYSNVGTGIWAGLSFFIAGIVSWIVSVKGSRNNTIFLAAIISAVVAVIASMVMIGLSATVIHEESNYPLIHDKKLLGLLGRGNETIEEKSLFTDIFNGAKEFAKNTIHRGFNKYQHTLCNTLFDDKCNFGIIKDILSKPSVQSSSRVDASVPQSIPGNRVALESVLLACGLISFIVNVFATCTQVMMINDPVTMA